MDRSQTNLSVVVVGAVLVILHLGPNRSSGGGRSLLLLLLLLLLVGVGVRSPGVTSRGRLLGVTPVPSRPRLRVAPIGSCGGMGWVATISATRRSGMGRVTSVGRGMVPSVTAPSIWGRGSVAPSEASLRAPEWRATIASHRSPHRPVLDEAKDGLLSRRDSIGRASDGNLRKGAHMGSDLRGEYGQCEESMTDEGEEYDQGILASL